MILTNFSGQPIFLSTCQSPSLFTESKALVRSMKVSILFSVFFLYLPRCEDHVCSASSSSKTTLAGGDDVAYADVITEAIEQHTSKNLSSSRE